MKAEFVTIPFETDGSYDERSLTVYNDDIVHLDEIIKSEIDYLVSNEADVEMHVYKLHKIIKPQRVVYEAKVLEPDETEIPVSIQEVKADISI